MESGNFNPRSHEGSDGLTWNYELYTQAFQSTLPRRERPVTSLWKKSTRLFQSTLPRRERHIEFIVLKTFEDDFNPRSHEGSDYVIIFGLRRAAISIHAPTKGATTAFSTKALFTEISIHAPTKGATPPSFCSHLTVRDFNPRSHEGSDGYEYLQSSEHNISIHAPTKGATYYYKDRNDMEKFQSTLPRRERQTKYRN